LQLAIAGMGSVQSLWFLAAPALREGKLERVLTSWEMPAPEVSILYPRDRHLPARTRATMDAFTNWIRKAIHDAG
jgi:LysR family transcriptional regulator, regulator for bpeEF and oprC